MLFQDVLIGRQSDIIYEKKANPSFENFLSLLKNQDCKTVCVKTATHTQQRKNKTWRPMVFEGPFAIANIYE